MHLDLMHVMPSKLQWGVPPGAVKILEPRRVITSLSETTECGHRHILASEIKPKSVIMLSSSYQLLLILSALHPNKELWVLHPTGCHAAGPY
jgi:hypothetical protein